MYYNHGVKQLPEIKPHATVSIRMGKTWEPATVTAQHRAPICYVVSTPDGTAYRYHIGISVFSVSVVQNHPR